jgi:hypothetical protein
MSVAPTWLDAQAAPPAGRSIVARSLLFPADRLLLGL